MKMTDKEIYTRYMYSYPHKTAYNKIEAVDIESIKNIFKDSDNSLYMHIPFCKTKCGYCNLFSIVGKNEDYFSRYVGAIVKHAGQLKDLNIFFNSFIIGGGTPLILSTEQLSKLFYAVSSILNIDLEKTFSCIETSPGDTNKEKIEILKENQINRVSIGIQSFLDSELNILNRNHDAGNVKASLNHLKEAGFPCLNIDLIYGIPAQTLETLRYSLDNALYYSPEEIFIYPLYIRKDSVLKSTISHNRYSLYLSARDYLLEHGYMQISMRRFTKDKNYNQSSCGFENTISLGAGGRSYIGNIHACLPYSNRHNNCKQIIDKYIESENKTQIDFGYILNTDEQKRRYVIKNLFITNGVDMLEYMRLFKSDIFKDFNILNSFMEQHYCVSSSNRIKLTPLGLSLSDYLGPMFISEEVEIKMKEWTIYDHQSI